MDVNDRLVEAARRGNLDEVKLLIKTGADIDARDDWANDTALHLACKEGHIDVVRELLSHEANVDMLGGFGWTALHRACTEGHVDVVRELLSNKASVDVQDSDGDTVLHDACQRGHLDVAALLLKNNANTNVQNKHGQTALHRACQNGYLDIAALLIKNKADVNVKDEDGKTSIELNMIIMHDGTFLHWACRNGYTDAVRELLSEKANVDAKNNAGRTALHLACEIGLSDIVALLVKSKANVNIKDNKGRSALHLACKYDRSGIVELLLKSKASTNVKDNDGKTPFELNADLKHEGTFLHWACRRGYTDAVLELLSDKANVDVKNNDGRTALHLACESGHSDIVASLVKSKANVNIKDNDGRTALHLACESGHSDIVALLVKSKANVNIKDKDGKKPIELTKTLNKRHSGIPKEIRGKKAKQIFRQALKRGQVPVHHIRLMTVGHFGVGKTTISKTLLQEVDDILNTTSTDGIEVYVGRCRIDLDTGEWEKQKFDPRTNTIRQKIQQLLYDERQQEILETKETKTSLNPFAENFIFRTRREQKATESPDHVPANVKHDATTDADLSEYLKDSASLADKDEKPSVQWKFAIHSEDDSKGKPQPTAKIASFEAKQFIPKEQDLLPSTKEPLKKFDENYCDLELWDFGGQAAFYTTHQTFLSPRCTYLLVIDGSQSMDDEVDDEELIPGQHTSRKCREFTRFWCVSIITYAKGTKAGYPKIIPVITHLDKVPEGQRLERVQYIMDEIRSICAEHNIEDHLILDPRLSINALNHNDNGYSVLREVILSTSKSYEEFGEMRPASWVPLEHSLMVMKAAGYKILPTSCLADINMKSELQQLEDEELVAFLVFQHSVGNLLYFTDSQLRNYIILHPKWLIDALRSLITADIFSAQNKTAAAIQRNLSSDGVLHYPLLEKLWKGTEYKEFRDNADHLLKTMEKMDLLAIPLTYDDEGNPIPGQRFIIPSMIKTDVKRELMNSLRLTQNSACLLFTFYSQLLPKAIFNKSVASCINIWPLEIHEDDVMIFAGFCSFQMDFNHRMTMRMLPYQILVMVTGTNQNQVLSNSLCAGVRHFLTSELSRICEVHKQIDDNSEHNKKFFIEIPCCVEHLECVTPFTGDTTDMTLKCNHHDRKDNLPGIHTWMQYVEGCSRLKDDICSVTNICPERKEQTLTSKELGRVSRRIKGTSSQVKASFLPEGEEFNTLEDDFNRGKIEIQEYCFRLFTKVNASSVTLERLQQDLIAIDPDNAHVLCKVIRRRQVKFESNLKAEFMFSKPSQELLNQLSNRIRPSDAFQLFIELGIDLIVIDRVRVDIMQNVLKQIRFILNEEWRKQTTPTPTFEILERALIESGIGIQELKQIAPSFMKE